MNFKYYHWFSHTNSLSDGQPKGLHLSQPSSVKYSDSDGGLFESGKTKVFSEKWGEKIV